MTNNKRSPGFTLIELLLAMAFISFMLLFVVSAMMQITRLYSKGSAIRQINQTGRQVVESLSASMRYAAPTYVPTYKRLCVGGTSYVWNIEGQPASDYVNKFDDGSTIRFVSVQDPGGAFCMVTPAPTNITKAKATDLVGADMTPLKLQVTQNGSLWDILVVISTAGSNLATPDASTPSGFACDVTNQFCAFGDFETSVYMRGDQ